MAVHEPKSIGTTTDAEIQERLEKVLEQGLRNTGDKGGVVGFISPSVACATFFCSVLIGRGVERQERVLTQAAACIQRQEELAKNLLKESKKVTWLTFGVFVLTVAVVGLTIALLIKG